MHRQYGIPAHHTQRNAIQYTKPLLVGLELTFALPPPPTALWLLLLATLLVLLPHFLRRLGLHMARRPLLNSSSEPAVSELLVLPELLIEELRALLRPRHLLRRARSSSGGVLSALSSSRPLSNLICRLHCTLCSFDGLRSASSCSRDSLPISGLCFGCRGGRGPPALGRGQRHYPRGGRAVLLSHHRPPPVQSSCSDGRVASLTTPDPQSRLVSMPNACHGRLNLLVRPAAVWSSWGSGLTLSSH